jgi:hypothetical protein
MGTDPTPPTPAARKRAARNARWAELRARGVPWRQIARQYEVSLSTVQRGVAEHERAVDATVEVARVLVDGTPAAAAGLTGDVTRVADIDVEGIFLMVVAAHLEDIDRLDMLARTSGHEGARVGAVKARLAAARSLADVLGRVGLLPNAEGVLMLRAEQERKRAKARQYGEAMLAGAAR